MSSVNHEFQTAPDLLSSCNDLWLHACGCVVAIFDNVPIARGCGITALDLGHELVQGRGSLSLIMGNPLRWVACTVLRNIHEDIIGLVVADTGSELGFGPALVPLRTIVEPC